MTLFTLILAFLPGFAWLAFYLHEDLHPEPKRLILLTFVMGAAWAIFAFVVETVMSSQFINLGVRPISIAGLLALAFVEEIAKFGAAYTAIHKNPNFDEPIDAMIYMVIASLGFATVENLGAVTMQSETGSLLPLGSIIETISFRFVGATLLHTLTAAILGYYWALAIRNFNAKRFLVTGMFLATLLHALFNYLIISYGNVIYSVVFVIIVGLFALNDFEKLRQKAI
jgi:RsiW-degrading membrane proteinase PrsW (M82 family)